MNYEVIKTEFIKLKKEELDYINDVAQISATKILSESEKLKNYRILKDYEVRLKELLKILYTEITKNRTCPFENRGDIAIEFELSNNYLSSINFKSEIDKINIFKSLKIDLKTFKFKLTFFDLIHGRISLNLMNFDIIENYQKLIKFPIYVFYGYYDSSEDCFGPGFGEPDDYILGRYEKLFNETNSIEEISRRYIPDFEKNKIIIKLEKHVNFSEFKEIFDVELVNEQNKTLNDCIKKTIKRVQELNYLRSPEYKEKILLDKINELYIKVKGEFVQKEILYNSNFLSMICETYNLPNKRIIKKEKIIKNSGKNSVIIIAITQDKKYIITFQNRIKDKIIAEFPSGYIENNETQIEAAQRELLEETGYISDDLFIVDEAYTSPGIDNSITYVVIANNCIKNSEEKNISSEFLSYGLFTEIELKYLVNNNIMNGSMNKLAYYNLVNNVDDCNIIWTDSNKRIYKTLRKKTNPFDS